MKTSIQLYFENNAHIFSSALLKFKIWIGWLIRLLKNWNFHIEFHSQKIMVIT